MTYILVFALSILFTLSIGVGLGFLLTGYWLLAIVSATAAAGLAYVEYMVIRFDIESSL